MAKRIALNKNIYEKDPTFWIYKELKRKGFIVGKYEIYDSDFINKNFKIREKVVPTFLKCLKEKESNFLANYEDKKDLQELLNLSNMNFKIPHPGSWEKVLPLYPLSPIN